MMDPLPPVPDFSDDPNSMLSDLPFQNEDADLYSWIEGLASAQMVTNGKDAATEGSAKGGGLRNAPSWLIPGTLGNPEPVPLFKDGSNASTGRSGSSDASQALLVPEPQFPLELDVGPIPFQETPAAAPQTPTTDAPYIIPDLPRAMPAGAVPALWSQKFPQVPIAGWPPLGGPSTGYQDSPMGEPTGLLPLVLVNVSFLNDKTDLQVPVFSAIIATECARGPARQ